MAPTVPTAAQLDEAVVRIVTTALAEDLGDAGDVTSVATVPADKTGQAEMVARAAGVVCGTGVANAVFIEVDASLDVHWKVRDGDRVEVGDQLAVVTGSLRSILTAERTALNLICHLSGVATATRRMADAVESSAAVIRDTRKTRPGLRLLEKYAVHVGGGSNHRVGLYDQLLVKDNHIAAAGSIRAAVDAALREADGRHVQVEVTDLDELREAIDAGATDILIDNFSPALAREAVAVAAGRASLEASGTVTLATVREYADTGVDSIAVGAVTHSAPWLDLALDVRSEVVDAGAGGVARELPLFGSPAAPGDDSGDR